MKKKITNSVILPSPSPTACVYLYIHLYTSICIFIYRGEKNINPKVRFAGEGKDRSDYPWLLLPYASTAICTFTIKGKTERLPEVEESDHIGSTLGTDRDGD